MQAYVTSSGRTTLEAIEALRGDCSHGLHTSIDAVKSREDLAEVLVNASACTEDDSTTRPT